MKAFATRIKLSKPVRDIVRDDDDDVFSQLVESLSDPAETRPEQYTPALTDGKQKRLGARSICPPIVRDPDHAAVVGAFQKLRQTQIEGFFYRLTRSRSSALIMREIMYWFMPSKADPTRSRSTAYRDGGYWFARTQADWEEKSDISRKVLETTYRWCADFLSIDHFKFKGNRMTHYRIDFAKLRALMAADRKLQGWLVTTTPLSAQLDTSACASGSVPTCSPGGTPYAVSSLVDEVQKSEDTGCAGSSCVSASPSGAAAPVPPLDPATPGEPAPPVDPENGDEELLPSTLSQPEALALLKQGEGKARQERVALVKSMTSYSRQARRALAYLFVWQEAYEEENEGRKAWFNEGHVQSAFALADQEISPQEFRDTLEEAWEVRGVSKGFDKLFMCRNHSRKFSVFCRHFTSIQAELAGA